MLKPGFLNELHLLCKTLFLAHTGGMSSLPANGHTGALVSPGFHFHVTNSWDCHLSHTKVSPSGGGYGAWGSSQYPGLASVGKAILMQGCRLDTVDGGPDVAVMGGGA